MDEEAKDSMSKFNNHVKKIKQIKGEYKWLSIIYLIACLLILGFVGLLFFLFIVNYY